MKNIATVALLTVLVAVPLAAATYVAPHTFVPGEQIKSSLFNDMNTALAASINNIDGATQVDDSAIVSANLAADCVGNFAISDGAIKAEQLNYTDSSLWDTMPVRHYAGTFTGDSSTTGKQIYCDGLRPTRVEVVCMTAALNARWTCEQRWDTTATFVDAGATRSFTDSTTYGAVRIVNKTDTFFTVYNSVAGITTPNLVYSYAYSVEGY